MDQYVGLERRGAEYAREYFVIDGIPKRQCYGYQDQLSCESGDCCPIRWPDGTEEVVRIEHKLFSKDGVDGSYPCDIDFSLPGFVRCIHAVETWVPLNAVAVKRSWAIEHSPESVRQILGEFLPNDISE